jgi:hypothetical protein
VRSAAQEPRGGGAPAEHGVEGSDSPRWLDVGGGDRD